VSICEQFLPSGLAGVVASADVVVDEVVAGVVVDEVVVGVVVLVELVALVVDAVVGGVGVDGVVEVVRPTIKKIKT